MLILRTHSYSCNIMYVYTCIAVVDICDNACLATSVCIYAYIRKYTATYIHICIIGILYICVIAFKAITWYVSLYSL